MDGTHPAGRNGHKLISDAFVRSNSARRERGLSSKPLRAQRKHEPPSMFTLCALHSKKTTEASCNRIRTKTPLGKQLIGRSNSVQTRDYSKLYSLGLSVDLKNSNSNSDGCPICNCILFKYFSCSFFFLFLFSCRIVEKRIPV